MLTTSHTLLDRLKMAHPPEEAWDRFVRLYTPVLIAWAKRQGFRDADAHDLAQEVMLKLLGDLPSYQRQSGARFRSWLYTVCARQGHDYRRRVATRLLPAADGLSGVDGPPPASAELEAEDQRQLVSQGLKLIRPDFSDATWAAFTGVMIQGHPVSVVALRLGLTENAVYQARYRVLTRLRQELAGLWE